MSVQASAQLARKLINTTEYHHMIEAGVFKEDDRIELIEGKLYEMSPIGSRHAAALNRLNRFFILLLPDVAIVSVHNPIELSEHSELEPDLTLLKWRGDFYAQSHPTPADVLVVIEVSDTTHEKDRGLKLPAYARAGIAEAWLVDLFNDRIEIHSQPGGGIYQEVRIVLRDHSIVSKAIPQLQLKVEDVLG